MQKAYILTYHHDYGDGSFDYSVSRVWVGPDMGEDILAAYIRFKRDWRQAHKGKYFDESQLVQAFSEYLTASGYTELAFDELELPC